MRSLYGGIRRFCGDITIRSGRIDSARAKKRQEESYKKLKVVEGPKSLMISAMAARIEGGIASHTAIKEGRGGRWFD